MKMQFNKLSSINFSSTGSIFYFINFRFQFRSEDSRSILAYIAIDLEMPLISHLKSHICN